MIDWSIMAPFLVSAVASFSFTLLYGFRSNWRSNPIGRMQFVKSCSIASILLLFVINTFAPEYWGREAIRHIVYWVLACSFCWQVYTLVKVQNGKIVGPNYGRRADDQIKKTPTDSEGFAAQVKE